MQTIWNVVVWRQLGRNGNYNLPIKKRRRNKREEYETNKRSRDRIDRRNYANREIMDEIKIDKKKGCKEKEENNGMEKDEERRCVAAASYLFRVTEIT